MSDETDTSSPDVLASKIIEIFKGDDRPVTQEQLAKCMAAMLTIETVFTKLLVLMAEMNTVGGNPKAPADELLAAMRTFRGHIGDVIESAKHTDTRAD